MGGASETAILSRVHRGVFHFNGEVWDGVSEDAKNLIRGLLTMDPNSRCTAAEALNHVWIAKLAPKRSGEDLNASMITNLRRFQEANALKQAALQVIANNVHEKEIRKIHDAFVAIDEQGDGDGIISIDELKMTLREVGAKINDLETLVQRVDCEGLGSIDYNEFVAATLDRRTYSEEEACWVAFNTFDKDGDGVISVTELAQFDSETLREDAFLVEHEKDGINFEQFLGMMRRGSVVEETAMINEEPGPRVRQSRRRSSDSQQKPVLNQGCWQMLKISGIQMATRLSRMTCCN